MTSYAKTGYKYDLPNPRTFSKAERRSYRAERKAMRAAAKQATGIIGVKRAVLTIHDAEGRPIHDSSVGATRFPRVFDDDILGLTVIAKGKAASLAKMFGETDTIRRLATGCEKAPESRTVEFNELRVFSPEDGQTGASYTSLIVHEDSDPVLVEDRETILAEFGQRPFPDEGHICFYTHPDAAKAERVKQEVVEWLLLPATAVLGPAEPFTFKG